MFRRLFSPRRSSSGNNNNDNDNNSNTPVQDDDDTSQPEDPGAYDRLQPLPEAIPSSPLVETTEGETAVRLYVEILGCNQLGPDYDENGKRVTKVYDPYVKIKLGDNDDKEALDIHKTKPVQQRIITREPIFDQEQHESGFCIDGMTVEELSKGLIFKVKDAAATSVQKKKKQDVFGWALVHSEALLWRRDDGMDASVPSCIYDEVENALEFELIHPTELVTGLAGKIHILVRPATDHDLQVCRKRKWGYFKPYTPVEDSKTNIGMERPPGHEVL